MEYKLDLGAWNSIFAVPCDIVDKHLKLAGAAQLKVILWVLRHAGEKFTTEDISCALSMSAADVRDSMLYWKETGIVCETEGIITPSPEVKVQTETSDLRMTGTASLPDDGAPRNSEKKDIETSEKKPSRALSRPEKPDIAYLTDRMNKDESIVYLMQTADEIFGRPTSNNEKETLLLIHEYDGLPVEVILMLMQYAADIGKCNARYIEKVAINWSDDEITTLERAEQRIQQLTSGRSAANLIMRLFGMPSRAPTERETKLADRWLNVWKFPPDVVKFAYEICVDAKGEYIPKYVNSVLERWYNSSVFTLDQAKADQQKGRKKAEKKKAATYDIEQFESTNAIFEEGF